MSRVYLNASVEKVMGAGRSQPRSYHEGGFSPRLEDTGVSSVADIAASSQEQDLECPSDPSSVAVLGGKLIV